MQLNSVLRSRMAHREFVPLALLVVVLFVSMLFSANFRDLSYLLRTSNRYMELSLTALTMTLIITAGMIDLSVPAIMSCAATITAVLFHGGLGMGQAVFCGLLAGAACGAINGLLVAYARLPAMIVTIGSMNLFRGISQIFIGDRSLGKFPEWFNGVDSITVFRIFGARVSVTVVFFVLLAVVFFLMLHKTSFGRQIFAIGANEQAAIHSGVNTRSIKLILFIMSGTLSAVAGILTMSRLLLVQYSLALNMEIDIVIMVLLGGADINGGRGSIAGTFIAVILVFILKTSLIVANITADTQMFIMGVILLVSIIIPNISSLLQEMKDK
ncbi:MAG: ABC transporter permease [Treponema sp.]|jgi:rhamnose transport system permease protein|nr:ABC transporter permease [Treponema sp.]